MTIKDLIELLQSFDPGDQVIIAKNQSSNAFSQLSQATCEMYIAHRTDAGEVKLREFTSELLRKGYAEEDVGRAEDGAVNCVTLWPIY